MKKPYRVVVKKGETIPICTCSYSKRFPICDGSHREHEGYKPTIIQSLDNDAVISICSCRNSKNLPFCDGSHRKKNI